MPSLAVCDSHASIRTCLFDGARQTIPGQHNDFDTFAEFADDLTERLLPCEGQRLRNTPGESSSDHAKRVKATLPYLAPYALAEGHSRCDENVEALTLLVSDFDACDLYDVCSRIGEADIAGVVYASPTDAPDGPADKRRCRVIVPVSREILPNECRHTRLAFAEALGLKPGCGADGVLPASIGFFVGRMPDAAEREHYTFSGKAIDVDALLARSLKHKWGSRKSTSANAAPADRSPLPPIGDVDPRDVDVLEALLKLHAPPGEDTDRRMRLRATGAYLAGRGRSEARIAALVSRIPTARDPKRSVALAIEGARDLDRGVENVAGWDMLSKLNAAAADALDRACDDAFDRRCRARREAEEFAPPANDTNEERAGCDPAVDYVITHLASPACGVYQRSGKLVTVTRDAREDGDVIRPEGAPTIRELVLPRLKEIIRMTAGAREASLAADVMARGEWSHVRPLDAIVSYPVMRRDGSLLLASGYDPTTRTLAEIATRVHVPDAPTQSDAREAVARLSDLVSDFPFAGDAQRSAWLAMLLTVPARPAIDGPTPLGLLEATQRGSGKSLLADALSIIVTGEPAARRVAPKTREEWDKVLFSILLAGDPLVLFDNVTNMLVSDALDAVLTGTVYSQRLLGVSEDRRVAIRTVFLASANNARLSTDLVRRSLGCRLEPNVEQPEARTGFRTPDLLGHVRRERARYLAAALTVLRAYALAGSPRVDSRPMGSYEAWCRVVRDALVWAGAPDPAVTQDALREGADVERDELRDLLTAWDALLGSRAVTVRELLDAAQTGCPPGATRNKVAGKFTQSSDTERALGTSMLDALRGITPNGAEPAAHTIGNRLRTMRGQIVDGLVLREGPRARGDRATYEVRRV